MTKVTSYCDQYRWLLFMMVILMAIVVLVSVAASVVSMVVMVAHIYPVFCNR